MNARVNFGGLERLLDWLKSLSDHQKYLCEKHESQSAYSVQTHEFLINNFFNVL